MIFLVILLMLGASAGLWIPIGMRIERGRQERIAEVTRVARERGGIRLRGVKIRR